MARITSRYGPLYAPEAVGNLEGRMSCPPFNHTQTEAKKNLGASLAARTCRGTISPEQ